MLFNKLQLNQSKTEFFVASSSRSSSKLCDVTLQLGDIRITPSKSLRTLGVIFDPALNMTQQVSSIIQCVSYHLTNTSRIRYNIDNDTCKLAVQSLIFSRIDYGNAFLLGATEKDLTHLQRLQNRAARLIHFVGRDHPRGGTDLERGYGDVRPWRPPFHASPAARKGPISSKRVSSQDPLLRKFGNFSLYSPNFHPNFSSQAPKFGNFQLTSHPFQRQMSVCKPHTSEIRAAHPYLKKSWVPPPPPDHPSASLLQELHWLPIRMHIQFKIVVNVYKCRHALAPEYLSELVSLSTVTYATRSSFDTSLLHIPKTKTVAGDSAFHAAAPRLWNKLPRNTREAPTIHVFKSLLKTHIFPAC